MWVLTEEYNDYDQHGEYFLDVWLSKPTEEQLKKAGVGGHEIDHVLNGGGRIDNEYAWYFLREVENK